MNRRVVGCQRRHYADNCSNIHPREQIHFPKKPEHLQLINNTGDRMDPPGARQYGADSANVPPLQHRNDVQQAASNILTSDTYFYCCCCIDILVNTWSIHRPCRRCRQRHAARELRVQTTGNFRHHGATRVYCCIRCIYYTRSYKSQKLQHSRLKVRKKKNARILEATFDSHISLALQQYSNL